MGREGSTTDSVTCLEKEKKKKIPQIGKKKKSGRQQSLQKQTNNPPGKVLKSERKQGRWGEGRLKLAGSVSWTPPDSPPPWGSSSRESADGMPSALLPLLSLGSRCRGRRLERTVPAAKVTSSLPPACPTSPDTIPPLAHPNPTQRQLPTPTLCSHSALERCPIHEMPFHPQTLQTVSSFAALPFFSLPSPPPAFSSSTSFYRTFWHCFGFESIAVHATGCGEINRAEKGVRTRLQKRLGLHFCLIRNGLTSCMVDGLYIDDSILQAD